MADDEEASWAKIRITQPVDEIIQYGPSIKIGVAPVPFQGEGTTIVLAQIDTGAAGTGISARLARKLNLKPVGFGEVHEAGRNPIKAPYFKVRLSLPSTDIESEVVGLATLDPPHDVLIGRDLLANCRLVVDFLSGLTVLHIKGDC